MRNRALGLAGCSLCMWVLSVALRTASSSFFASGDSLNPETDFASLGTQACLIVRVDHASEFARRRLAADSYGGDDATRETQPRELRTSSSSSSDDSRQCYDMYTYSFVIRNESTGLVFKTIDDVDKQSRPGAGNNEACQEYQTKASPKFDNGTHTECWKPVEELDGDKFELYQCGNPSCVKIYSPSDAKENLIMIGTILLYVSWMFGLVGVATAAGAFIQYSKSKNAQHVQPQSQPYQVQQIQTQQQGGAIMLVPQQNQSRGIQLTAPQQNTQNWPGTTQQQQQQQSMQINTVIPVQQGVVLQQPQANVVTVLPGGVVAQPQQSTPYSVPGGVVQPLVLQPMPVPQAK